MVEIDDLLKCPGCHRVGTMEITIRKKTAEVVCQACNEIVTSRVPYPKNRGYGFKVPSVKGIGLHG